MAAIIGVKSKISARFNSSSRHEQENFSQAVLSCDGKPFRLAFICLDAN
jgi:hypothetical protein